ncbi:MAG: TolC family protein [Marinilabiliales bacterium]|nr:TolC family protein [Marinilabiliales bacterium]
MKIKILVPLLGMLFTTCMAFSQQDSLQGYLKQAADRNPSLLQKKAIYEAALRKAPQAASLPDPELSAGVFLKPMEFTSGNQLANFRLMQMFPWFGYLKNARDEMSLMALARFAEYRQAGLDMAFEVHKEWLDLYTLQKELQFVKEDMEMLRSIEKLALVKAGAPFSSAGTAPSTGKKESKREPSDKETGTESGSSMSMNSRPSANGSMETNLMSGTEQSAGIAGVYRIQMEIKSLENKRQELDEKHETARIRFNTLLNRATTLTVALPDSLAPIAAELLTDWPLDSLIARSPMVAMQDLENQSLQARQRMVKAMGYPMIGLGIDYSLFGKNPMSTSEMNGKDMVMPMVTLTLPLYRKKYREMAHETSWMLKSGEAGRQAAIQELVVEYAEGCRAFRDAARKATFWEEQNRLAQASYRIYLRTFAASGSSLNDLLSLRRELLDNKFKRTEAVAATHTALALVSKYIPVIFTPTQTKMESHE